MKNKLTKIIFIISFLPYLLILGYGAICMFTGVSFFFSTSYGFEAFIIGILPALYFSTLVVPIVPVCAIYQICYLLRKKFKKTQIKKYIKICVITGCIIIGTIMIFSHSFEIGRIIEKENAKQMIKNAEEKIGFNENDIKVDGIFNIPEYRYSHVLIDYDNVEVGMLLNADRDEFWKVKLKKTTKDSVEYQHIINDYYMQADIPLSYPGRRLISFYEDKSLMHRTIAFLLIYTDGTIYFADNIKEKDTGYTRFTGLHWSKFFVGENVKYKEF